METPLKNGDTVVSESWPLEEDKDLRSFKLFEVVNHSTTANLSGSPQCIIMSQKTWDSLPKHIQKTLRLLMS